MCELEFILYRRFRENLCRAFRQEAVENVKTGAFSDDCYGQD